MHSWIAAITGLVMHHPGLALVVAFVSAVLEAVVIVGALVPGTAVMMAVAGVAATAGLPKIPFVLAGAAGAVVGDTFTYWVGWHFGGHIRGMWPFSHYPAVLAQAELFFARFGAPSVAIARFVPGLRAAVPLVAGMAGMRLRTFLVADILAAMIWAPLHIVPAQFAGLALGHIKLGDWQTAAAIGAGLLVLAVAAWLGHRLMRRLIAVGGRRGPCQSPASRSRRDVAAR